MQKAHHLFMLEHYNEAVEAYNSVITASPTPEAYYSRALCFLKMAKYSEALKDLNQCSTSNIYVEALFQRGIANFSMGKLNAALTDFKKSNESNSRQDLKNITNLWISRCQNELGIPSKVAPSKVIEPIKPVKPVEPVVEKPKEVVIPPKPIRPIYSWYQTPTDVIIDFQAKNLSEEKVTLTTAPKSIEVDFVIEKDCSFQYSFDLFAEIFPDKVVKQCTPKKCTITLKKKYENIQWSALEEPKQTDKTRCYPSSNKSAKNWDKIEKDVEKEILSEKPEGEEAMMTLFKQIYERGDEKTKQAMIKSYQTSGGTVLSTNWKEVKEKDYEGKDRPEAPAGQKWVKDK